MTIEELNTEISQLYKSLKQPLDRTPEGLLGEIDFRCQWLARSAELLAESQAILDTKRGDIAEKFAGSEESWNIIKNLIEARASDEKRIFVLADRLNATLTHQLDSIRSILSFEKESLRNTK